MISNTNTYNYVNVMATDNVNTTTFETTYIQNFNIKYVEFNQICLFEFYLPIVIHRNNVSKNANIRLYIKDSEKRDNKSYANTITIVNNKQYTTTTHEVYLAYNYEGSYYNILDAFTGTPITIGDWEEKQLILNGSGFFIKTVR